jgi:hypothetical protein
MTGHLKRSAVLIAVFAITVSFGLYFRMYPAVQNIHRQSLKISRISVLSNLRKTLSDQVSQNHPEADETEKRAASEDLLRSLLKSERGNFDTSIKTLAKELVSSKKFYLLGADPYYYYLLTKNLVRTGRLSDRISEGKFFDPLMMAPHGHWRNFEVHPYTGLIIYNALRLFGRDISLFSSVSIVPLILYPICLFFFILCCLELRISPILLFVSGFFFSLSPIFIQRSCIGWYDTDPYNLIFPLASLFFMSKIFSDPEKRGFVWLLAFVCGLFSVFWQGWVLLPIIVTASLLTGCFFSLLSKRPVLPLLTDCGIYLLGTAVTSAFLLSPTGLASSMSETLSITRMFSLLDMNIWPDVFLTIGELKRASPVKIMYLTGGPVFSLFAIYGFLMFFFAKKSVVPFGYRVSICIFTVIFAVMSAKGERFAIFLIGPASLCFAFGLNSIFTLIQKPLLSLSRGNLRAAGAMWLFFLTVLLASPLTFAHIVSSRLSPIFNETWDSALTAVNSLSPKNSIVNSWWPPGHFIRAVAERGVTFDGATPEAPQSFWIASFFMSDNESEAIGILRMLNAGGNKATEFLTSEGISTDKAVEIIKNIVKKNRAGAISTLKRFLPEDKAVRLASLTHGDPPPSFCFIYNDLIKNMLGLYYVDRWDFSKAIAARERTLDPTPPPGSFIRGTKENIALMWRISGGMPYIGEESFRTHEKDGIIFFSNGVSLNTSDMTARITSLESRISGTPESIILPVSGGLTEKPMEKPDLRLSVLFIRRDENRTSCIVAPSRVLRSVIFRLYYLNGLGLRNFEPFILEENPALDTKILIYRINWPEI